jgi:hypothetical protein
MEEGERGSGGDFFYLMFCVAVRHEDEERVCAVNMYKYTSSPRDRRVRGQEVSCSVLLCYSSRPSPFHSHEKTLSTVDSHLPLGKKFKG